MINLKKTKNQKFNLTKSVALLFYTIPLSFILGNVSLNLHLLVFLVASLFLIKIKNIPFRFKNVHFILITFFLYLILVTLIQFQTPGFLNEAIKDWPIEKNPIFKSIFFVRFLILIFVVDTLFYNKILNLKKLFLFSLVCTTFVCFDIIFQYVFGFDLFGYKSLGDRNPGPFGDEWIAGTYLQKFSFISIFFIYEWSKNKNFNKPLFIFITTLHATAMILAGNRMPMLLFVFGCILIVLLVKNLRIIMSASIFVFALIFLLIIENDSKFKATYSIYLHNIIATKDTSKVYEDEKKMYLELEKRKIEKEGYIKKEFFFRTTGHDDIFRMAIVLWKQQPLFGFGHKSFRIKCWEIWREWWKYESHSANLRCATHPHNYYFELISEVGIVGTILMLIIFFILLKDSVFHLKKYNKKINSETILLIPIAIILFLEIWPIKSSGSFFTTWNASFFWLNAAILFAAKPKKLDKN